MSRGPNAKMSTVAAAKATTVLGAIGLMDNPREIADAIPVEGLSNAAPPLTE